MLSVNKINTFYGPIQALYDVSIEIGEEEIVSIIGANGAGKSSLMKSIIGLCHPQNGEVIFNGVTWRSCLPIKLCMKEWYMYRKAEKFLLK